MALGAQREDIVRMIMRQAAILAAAGVIPGLLIAYAAGRSMQSLLAGVQPADVVQVSLFIWNQCFQVIITKFQHTETMRFVKGNHPV